MSLNKKTMVREIGRRTRLKNRDVQAVIETLINVWTEELVAGGRIEIENFMVLEIQTNERAASNLSPYIYRKVLVRVSKTLRELLSRVP